MLASREHNLHLQKSEEVLEIGQLAWSGYDDKPIKYVNVRLTKSGGVRQETFCANVTKVLETCKNMFYI